MRFGFGRKAAAAAVLASALALGGCYDGYGYSGVSAGYGYGNGLYGDGLYGGGPYAGYGGVGAGYGWYDGFYYPGNGYYIYDRGGARHRWNDRQRRYWESRGQRVPDGRWAGRPGDGRWRDRPGEARRNGRPDGDGRWRDRANRVERPPVATPGVPGRGWSRGDRGETARAARGQGVWGAFPRGERARVFDGRGGGGGGGRPGRGNPRP